MPLSLRILRTIQGPTPEFPRTASTWLDITVYVCSVCCFPGLAVGRLYTDWLCLWTLL